MLIIGVIGGSGTGKSTVTQLLNEKIGDCVSVNLDDYMRKYWDQHKQEIISKLNLNIESGHWHTHLVNNYEDVKMWVSIIASEIERDVRNIISKNSTSKAVILDWSFLPLIPIYNECDFSILVKCDFDIRVDRLTKELMKNDNRSGWNKETLFNRLKNSQLEEFGHFATYTIYNNGTLEDYKNKLEEILKQI